MKYKISIIIPVFNAENYIKRALDSILKQTIGYRNLEVFMVDDHSTDQSSKIMEGYADKYDNFTAIYLPENSRGAGKPRNAGMKEATSDYLMFLDADDEYTADACEVLYEKIISSDADIVSGTYTLQDEATKKRRSVNAFLKYADVEELILNTIADGLSFLDSPPALWSKIFRHKFVQENNITFPVAIPNEDQTFVTHSFLKAKGIVFINKAIVHYDNLRTGSISNQKESLTRRIRGYWYTYDVCRENGTENYFIDIILKNKLKYWIENFINLELKESEKKESLKEVWSLFSLFKDYESVYPPYLKQVYQEISDKNFDDAILLLDQQIHFKEHDLQLKKTNHRLLETKNKLKKINEKASNLENSIKENKSKFNVLKDNEKKIRSKLYEVQYNNGYNRPFKERLVSFFPSIYLLLNLRKSGLKNSFLNIRGYYSIKKKHLIDVGYYLLYNGDVRASGADPIIHYITKGFKEGRKPHPNLNMQKYYEDHQDELKTGINPLVHYSIYGDK